ncbi:MAG: Gfo/Idh/MocA family oxidoreductase [Planctomycetes bacterium]|nr:Gfo/Idh/MocA family oxidoreductase [Planctomycetota bacterium]
MAAKTYRVAVIGRTGKGNYGHGLDTVWLGMDNVEIVAVADENEVGRAAATKRLKAKTSYADYKEMLQKEKPNIVSVADRFLDMHHDMVIACAEAGASMFIEKPLCRTLQEADEMIAACEKHHVKVAIAHQTRYSPRIKVAKDLIAEGKIGDIIELRGRGKEDTRGGGQDMMVLGTHIFDLMRLFAGDPRWCFSRIWQEGKKAMAGDAKPGGEGMGLIQGDRIFAEYGFDNGVVGTFGTHKAKDGIGSRFGLHIMGSKGIIHLTTGSLPPAYFLAEPSWMPGKSKAVWQEITSAGLGNPEPLKDTGMLLGNRLIVNDLIESIEKDRQPKGSIYDGRASLEMILAAYESHKVDRPVDLPLKNRKHPLGV